jgi:hypothetical protein
LKAKSACYGGDERALQNAIYSIDLVQNVNHATVSKASYAHWNMEKM